MTRIPKPEKALAAILALSVSELRSLAVLLVQHEPDAARLLAGALATQEREAGRE